MDIITPQRLYHGTADHLAPSFRRRVLDARYWRPGRDFGEGFYTTISAAQARKWAMRVADAHWEPVRPCVLELELTKVPAGCEPLVFLSDSLAWARLILGHRLAAKGADPCPRHPDIIIGPMADGDTGKVLNDCVQLNKDANWFYERIVRSSRGLRLDSLRLGNQVVFASEKWESSLRLVGYHIQTKGRWIFHDGTGASSVESV